MDAITLQARSSLLLKQPCFQQLSSTEITVLAQLLFEQHYPKGQLIVAQNELIDRVYIIASGTAEVTQIVADGDKSNEVLLAKLGAGEAIGLNDTGFYSQSGARTASVIATSEIHLLGFTLVSFQQMLYQYPTILPEMQSANEQMLRMNFIKKVGPFVDITIDQLQWLAQQVKEVGVAAGTKIIKENDMGDHCYFILSGKVAIEVYQDGKQKHLATLEAPAVFGEAAMLMDIPRSATARAIENCQLLMLQRDSLLQLLSQNNNSTKALIRLVMDRSRPIRKPGVTVHQRPAADGQMITTLRDRSQNKYYQLSPEGYFIWEHIDGNRTLKDLILVFSEKFNQFVPTVISSLIINLGHAGFIDLKGFALQRRDDQLSTWVRVMQRIRRILEATYVFNNTDAWLSVAYQKGVKYVFTWPVQLLFIAFIIGGLTEFGCYSATAMSHLHYHMPDFWWLIIAVDLVAIFAVSLHELAHAFTTKAYGFHVNRMGVGWYWFGPIAFTDTSDMWLSGKWPRIVVNIAGMYIDLVIAGISAILSCLIVNPHIAMFFWLFSIFNYLSVFRNLDPIIELDGYYVLADLFDRPHLREDAVTWLVETFPKVLRHPTLVLDNKVEAAYWLISTAYIILSAFITWSLQHYILGRIFPLFNNPWVLWGIPAFVIVLSILSVWAQVKANRQR